MSKKQAKIRYLDLYGLREEKYKFLESHDVKNTEWQELELKEPYYWFVPKETRGEEKYQKFSSLEDIFIFNNVGGKPGDDALLVGNSNNELKVKINQFVQLLKIDSSKARTEADKNLLRIIDKFETEEKNIIPYNYRPFDIKKTYYDSKIYTRSVPKLKNQFNKKNTSLLVTKIVTSHPFQHVFVSEIFPDVIFLSNRGSTNTYVFPLYLYEDGKQKSIFSGQKHLSLSGTQKQLDQSGGKKSNIKQEIIERLSKTYKKEINPEEIFYYIYAVLYSNTYRKKYNEFLKIDFPRVPFADDYQIFQEIAKIGKNLIDLHLLKSEKLEKPIVKFPKTGESIVKKREYSEKEKRIYINENQYFENIEPEIWNYYIGGYQVLDKWLKDRVGKILSSEDVNHFLKVITALYYTIEIQKEIDKIYPKVEENLYQ